MTLTEKAKKAISYVFSDTSVNQKEVLENLRELQEEIELLIDAIETDIKNK